MALYDACNVIFVVCTLIKKICYERRAYESVDEKSLPYVVSRKKEFGL